MMRSATLFGPLVALAVSVISAQPRSNWADFVEPDFPFFSSVLDARGPGGTWSADNLTPRGLILNLGHDMWACFDTELLRVSAVWSGAAVTPVGMAQGSYHVAGAKAPEGQGTLTKMAGVPWLVNGLYPGWQRAEGRGPALVDPRPAGPDPRELGRGPLDPAIGRFRGLRLTAGGVVLEYDVENASVREQMLARDGEVERRIRVEGGDQRLDVVLGRLPSGALVTETIPVSPRPYAFSAMITRRGVETRPISPDLLDANPPPLRWPQVVATRATLALAVSAFVVDRIEIPTGNPWRRNVRLADVAFLGGGRAAAVTFDGDVWTIDGLAGNLERVTWRRFASGLHEPLSLAVRDGRIFVFDRNGLWRLHDTDGNGEADRHELFANGFTQTAETREFAMSLRVAPDGSFVIAKGGQAMGTVGRDNGSVLRISADGRTVSKLGYGLRQPFASVSPTTGLVIASDQQGHYVPSTPIHEIREGRYYGFLPVYLPKEQYPAQITEPIAWIPHSISASAAGQIWTGAARMGPVSEGLVLVNYYPPELFLVRLDERSRPLRASLVSLTRDFDFAPLAGAVNPADGQVYVAGFQIWGTEAKATSGLARLRYTGTPSTLPRDVQPAREGVLLRFDVALDRRTAADPANYSAERWNYRRSAEYGSPHFTPYLQKGQETMIPSSAFVSLDGKSVFIGIPGMQPIMQMRLGWTLKTQAGAAFAQSAYFTPGALSTFAAVREGFGAVTVDLTPRPARRAASGPARAETGAQLAARFGCAGCHSTDGTVIGRVGPSWKGLYGTRRTFADRSTALADDAYLRESILEPSARTVAGFEQSDAGMPSYAGVLTEAEIEAIVRYIQTLR